MPKLQQPTFVCKKNFEAFENPEVKIIVNQGGARSSKTISIAQLIILHCLQTSDLIITIVRKTTPALHSSVMRDFFWLLQRMGLYSVENHNKSLNEYRLNGNLIEFISMDVAEKKKGTKRDILWLNEATEFDYEDYFQLSIRTTGKIFLDYNPSYEFHWIYEKVLVRQDAFFIQSSYKDNPYLEQSLIDEIERLKDIDENYWKIYGLGEKGQTKAIIFNNWKLVDDFPHPDTLDEVLFGIDFGYNNPSSLIQIGVKDKINIYVKQLLYARYLTNTDLITQIKELIPDHWKQKIIKADSAEPDRIEEIKRAGFYIEGSKKGKNSIKDGIDVVKRKVLYITKDSSELLKEIRSYKWKEDKDGKILDEPVKFNDHAISAMRYAIEDLDLQEGRAGAEVPDIDVIGRNAHYR